VPIFGVVGPNGILRPHGQDSTAKRTKVRIPLAMGDAIALLVEGQSLYPRYDAGTLLICPKTPEDPSVGIGRECHILMPDGVGMIRRIERGARSGVYNLTIHNAPPMLNEEVMNCRPIIAVLPPE
jgi:hypothetical protein